MTPEQLSAAIRDALASAVAAGQLTVAVPDEVRVERCAETAFERVERRVRGVQRCEDSVQEHVGVVGGLS